jgi:hypothetical protein
MSRISKLLLAGSLALATLAPMASAQRVFFRGSFGPGYYGRGYYGPGFGWYGPGWGPYGYVSGPPTGSLKFEHTLKETAVFVDGGFAGTVGELKTFKMHPGSHNIELKTPDGHSFFQERVSIVAGHTLKITP